MTRLEKLIGEKRDCVAAIENIRAELDKGEADEARVKELDGQLEKSWEDCKRIDKGIDAEERLEAEKKALEAKMAARAFQAKDGKADNAYQPLEGDRKGREVDLAKRRELLDAYERGEDLDADQLRVMHMLTDTEKAFWSAAKDLDTSFKRALSTTAKVGADADGGFTIPEGFQAEVVRGMKAYGPMHMPGVTRMIVTSMGNDIPWPTADDTGNKGRLIAEAADATDKKVTFGNLTLKAYKYTTDMFPVTAEILQDSGIGFESLLRSFMSERFGRILNDHFTLADGSSKPEGLVTKIAGTTARVVNVETAVKINFDDMRNLITKLDPAYRSMGRFMFNSNTEAALLKVKDGDDRFMWQPDVAMGTRNRIWGYPYMINQDMAEHNVANKDAVIFGDFMKFVCRRVRSMTIRRLDELYARSDQIAFVGFGRFDSRVLDTKAFAVLHTDAT